MKRTIKILSLALVFIMSFGVLNAFAKGKTLSNDKFYAESPENFNLDNTSGYDHYYFVSQDELICDFEIFVEGNILFPEGIKDTDLGVIKDRFLKFYSVEESTKLEIKKAEKGNINGITACYIYGIGDDGVSEEFIHAYLLTTKENLYIVSTASYDESFEKEPEFLKEFMSSFLVNGTYFNGEKLTESHDFSKAEHYIDALERDVLTDSYYTYHSGTVGTALFIIFVIICFPIVTIVLFVLYIKTKKKLKEYKEFFGSIEQARMTIRQQYMQNGYQPYQNNGQYHSNVPNMNPYNPGTQTAQQYQSQQPVQNTLPPEMQQFQNNNENKF